MAMRTKHFPKEDNSTKVLKHQVSYKSAKCCPPGLRREDRRRVTAKGSGGECLTAKRTFRNGHVSVRCRQRRSVPFSCIKGDPAPSAGRHLEWHAQRRRKVSRRANIRGRRPNPCERGELILIEHNSTKATSCQVSFTFWSRGLCCWGVAGCPR